MTYGAFVARDDGTQPPMEYRKNRMNQHNGPQPIYRQDSFDT